MEQRWVSEAACRTAGVDMFPRPTKNQRPPTPAEQLALAVCARCVVRGACLEYAARLKIDHGVWGGTIERERRTRGFQLWARRLRRGEVEGEAVG